MNMAKDSPGFSAQFLALLWNLFLLSDPRACSDDCAPNPVQTSRPTPLDTTDWSRSEHLIQARLGNIPGPKDLKLRLGKRERI